MGRSKRHDRRFPDEGVASLDAGGVRESDHARQVGDKERIRVSDLPDQDTWAHLHLDVQSQDPRQA